MDSLWAALDLVREREMLKGDRGMKGGPHCALGFLDEALDTIVRSNHPEVKLVAAVAAEAFPGRDDPRQDRYNFYNPENQNRTTTRLAAFNNHPDTTKDDLEMVFHKAAIKSDEILGD